MDCPASQPVVADFFADIREQLRALIEGGGYEAPDTTNTVEMVEAYFVLQRRIIEPLPRAVHRSRELDARELVPIEAETLAEIARRSVAGEPLIPFQHDKLNQRKFPDTLLTDWGLHHLHLGGTEPGKNGFTKRSQRVLFVVVRPDDLYMVDVAAHRRGDDAAFCGPALVEIVHANWPELIAHKRAIGISNAANLTTEQRQNLRQKGANAAIQVSDGTVYLPPGGGHMSARWLGMDDRVEADRLMDRAHRMEEACRAQSDEIHAKVEEVTGRRLDLIRLKLVLGDEGLKIVEMQTGVEVRLTFPA